MNSSVQLFNNTHPIYVANDKEATTRSFVLRVIHYTYSFIYYRKYIKQLPIQ